MVQITDFNEFQVSVRTLFTESPRKEHIRFAMKYNHGEAELVLRVTDDATCFTFPARGASGMKSVEVFISEIQEQLLKSVSEN